MKPKKPRHAVLRLPGVLLDAASVAAQPEPEKPVWIQIAVTGLWKGYRAGQVEFTRQVLDTMVENFRANPAYERGPDGVGIGDVVPWDFNHASEQDPTLGDLPIVGAPAQAWTLELEVRPGDGPAFELWSLTRLLEPVRGYIAAGKIKWASVGVWKSAVDPVSGRDIGPLLTSVAFTNNPFIQGMAPIGIAARMDVYVSRASDAEDALCQIRCLLGLPQLTELGAVQLELAKLKMWLDAGQVPIGVDADEIVAGLRQILGLPALAGSEEVFAELGRLVPALVEQQAQESAEGAGAETTCPHCGMPCPMPMPAVCPHCGMNLQPAAGAPMMAANRGAADMDPKKVVMLTAVLGLGATTPEDQIIQAAQKAVDAAAKLGPLLKALGVEDAEGAIGKITNLMRQAAELEAAMPELKSLREDKKKKDDASEEADVGDAIAAGNLPAHMRDALLLLRRTAPEKFKEQFPVARPGERHLGGTLFANSQGAQFGSAQTGTGRIALTAVQGGGNGAAGEPSEAEIDAMPGVNVTEKAMAYVRAHAPAGASLAFDAVHEQASRIVGRLRERRASGGRR